jgi:hypothetical protein
MIDSDVTHITQAELHECIILTLFIFSPYLTIFRNIQTIFSEIFNTPIKTLVVRVLSDIKHEDCKRFKCLTIMIRNFREIYDN